MLYILYQLTLVAAASIKHSQYTRVAISLICLCYFGLTYPGGNDVTGYFLNYNCIVNSICEINDEGFEPGFNLFVLIFGQLGYQSLLYSIALFNVLLIYIFSKKFKNGGLIFLMLMSVMAWTLYTEALRQAMAISITLLAIPYLAKKDFIRFSLWIVVASLFHSSAIISFVVLGGLMGSRAKVAMLLSTAAVVLVFAIDQKLILDLVLMAVPETSDIFEKLFFYTYSEIYAPQLSIGIGVIPDILMLGLLMFLIHKLKPQKQASWIIAGTLVFIVFVFFLGRLMPVLTRLGWYGLPYLALLISPLFGGGQYLTLPNNIRYKSLLCGLVCIWVLFQIARPFTYLHSSQNIEDQKTIFNSSAGLSDEDMEDTARAQCIKLHRLGYNYLCDY